MANMTFNHLCSHLLHDDARHLVAPLVIAGSKLLPHVPRVGEEPARQRPTAATTSTTVTALSGARREPSTVPSAIHTLKMIQFLITFNIDLTKCSEQFKTETSA